MVIELTDGLAQCPKDKMDALSVSIENLLIGYYEGNHILMISAPFCKYIRDHNLIKSDRAYKALYVIEENGAYDLHVLWHLLVVLENADPAKHEVDYSFFTLARTILPTAFLCENLDDIKFYMQLAERYFPNTRMISTNYHGGGGTTAEVFCHIKKLKVPCLVILDSDVKYPGCKKGDTAKRCLSRYKKENGYIEVKMLDVHEAENLLPIEFLKTVATSKASTFLKLLEAKRMLDKLIYLDIKEGVRKEDVINDLNYKSFCEEIYDKLYKKGANNFAKYIGQKKNDSDYIFVPITSKLLEKYIDSHSQLNKNNFLYHDDIMTPYRKQIAELVQTFTCCRGLDPLN